MHVKRLTIHMHGCCARVGAGALHTAAAAEGTALLHTVVASCAVSLAPDIYATGSKFRTQAFAILLQFKQVLLHTYLMQTLSKVYNSYSPIVCLAFGSKTR